MKKQPRRSLLGRTLHRVNRLFAGRQRREQTRRRRDAFLVESLESRHLMAGDLDQGEGEGTSPTLAALPNIVLNSGSPQWVPLDGFDADAGDTITYTVTSANPGLVDASVPTGNKSLKMSVADFGDMYFQLFEHLTPRVTSRIIELVSSGFYDDTATNTVTFHRILNDFVIQAGDPTGTGAGGSNLGDFDDQFHVDLQHNRSGLLSMAKTTDDTNDSQFFITEERDEIQFVTLAGSPTGGTFTLSYFNEVTGPIAFTGDFTAMAASIESALEGLSRIGAGNVTVIHDPIRNGSGQITDNRRWRVTFTGDLGHQEVVNLTGNASGLTGGANRLVVIDEVKSARHLDFNHSIFGILTEGESVRDAISNVTTNSQGTPLNAPVISNIDVLVDPHNGALLLKANAGATGETDITVRATDSQGNFVERTFHVVVTPDSFDGAPFLNDIGPVSAVGGQTVQLQLTAQDAEDGPLKFSAVKPAGNTVNYALVVSETTGLVAITPPAGFVGTFQVEVRVEGSVPSDTGDPRDSQLVTVTVAPPAPGGIDLLAASDTGFSSTDDITNAGTAQFQISGVTSGALVKLKKGDQVLASGTASGATINLTVNDFHSLGDGVHSLQATQTIGGAESAVSATRDITLDTTAPGAFTSTPPTEASVGQPLLYDANAPGEGTAGFVFSLTNAPQGATVNGVTGEVTWTPVFTQIGNQVFQVVATDAAGNATSQTINLVVDEPVPAKIEISFTITTPTGQPLTALDANQEFMLNVFVEDVRGEAVGVAGTYMDILFDAARAEAIGAISFNTAYFSGDAPFAAGNTSTPGLIDELGSFRLSAPPAPPLDPQNPGDPFKVRLASIPMRAKQSGVLTFTTNPADDTEAHISAVFVDEQLSVDFEEIRFGTTSITVDATFAAVNDTFNVNEDSQNQTLTPLANDTIDPGSGNVLTISAVGATSSGGSVVISSDGKSLLYTPAANFFGSETFTYTARNQNNETSQATITVQVAPQNDPPTAVDDTANVAEDSTATVIDVLANDLMTPDAGETLKVTAVTQPTSGGTAAIGPNGNSVTFTPAPNFIGTATFSYTLSDGNGGTDTATVTVTVTEANDNPVAVNDTATVNEDSGATTINVLANDTTGPDTGETLTVTAVGQTSNGGTVTIGEGGANVSYTPAANFQGIETFTYTISDGRGGTATGIVSVTVANANNDPPTAAGDTLTAFKDTPAVLDVLANDTSAPDPAETLTIEAVTQPANGTVAITNNGTRVTYTPNAGFTGADSFTYTIRDPGGAISQSATVNLTVQNFVPSTLSGFVYFDVDNDGVKDASESPIAGVTITLTGTDMNGAAVNRTLKTLADGSYKFDNLTPGNYTIAQTQPGLTIDGKEKVGSQGGTSTQNDRIVIANLAQNTSGTNNNFGERGRQASLITLRDFFASRSRSYALAALDSAGNTLWSSTTGNAFQEFTGTTFSLVNNATQIKIEGTNGGQTPVSATLPVSDSRIRLLGTSGTTRLFQVRSFNLGNPTNNTPPTAVADTFAATEDTPLVVAVAGGVLKNDTDPNAGQTLTATVVTQPTKGTLTLNANGSFTYTPNLNANGADTFTYRAGDGIAQSSPATVTINIAAVNDAPVAANDNFTATRDTALTVNQASGVLANDSDVEGATLTATVVAQPQHGTVTLNSNGSFTYTPATGYTGPDSFTYRASDGTLTSGIATVNITVQAPNVAPVGQADSFTTDEDTPLAVSAAAQGVLANDTDANPGTTLTAVLVSGPEHGELTLNANGTFTYTPDANYNGPDSFTYRASDGTLQSDPVTVSLTVTAVNDAPTAVNDAYTVAEDGVLVVEAEEGVLDNDSDVETTTLIATLVSQPEHGELVLNADGSFEYTPDENFHGTDGFSYRAGDGTLQSDVVAVTITVTPVTDAPLAAADSFTTPVNEPLSIAAPGLLANDTDADGNETISVVLTPVAGPQHGTLTLAADGSFLYTPETDYAGPDSFTYEITDGTATSQATVSLTVEDTGGGEGEASDAALLGLLTGEDSDSLDEWQDAVDEILAQLA